MSEPLNRLLAGLPLAEPDPVRTARVRESCRARLARSAPRPSAAPGSRRPLWQPLIAALGVAYLIAAVAQAVAVFTSNF
ncbi:MAG TPA: hypothetical protein VFA27_11855 [Vicinamibacterales bacterium]|nr:hypothetical protein [Vicinamibacterales bacterium]